MTVFVFTEETPIHTSSPYSSSKAGADLLVLAYHCTYGLPVTVSRCSNNYGPYHFPEKLIPLMIVNALNNKPLPVYGEGINVRDWLYVEDHCKAIDLIIHKGRVGEVYNIGGHNEIRNIDVVKLICKELGKSESLITHVTDRDGHDMRPRFIMNEVGFQRQILLMALRKRLSGIWKIKSGGRILLWESIRTIIKECTLNDHEMFAKELLTIVFQFTGK